MNGFFRSRDSRPNGPVPSHQTYRSSANGGDKPATLRELEHYFVVELELDDEGRVKAVWHVGSRDTNFTDEMLIRKIEVKKICMDDLELQTHAREIRGVEDIQKFLDDDFPNSVSKLTFIGFGSGRERRVSVRRREDVSLPPKVVSHMVQQKETLARREQSSREELEEIDFAQFDDRHRHAVRETLPTEIVKLEVERQQIDAQAKQLKSLQHSHAARLARKAIENAEARESLADIAHKLQQPNIEESEKAALSERRAQKEKILRAPEPPKSHLIAAILGTSGPDSSISDSSIEQALAAIEQKSKIVSRRIQELELTLAEADRAFRNAKENRSKATRLNSEISKLKQLQDAIAEWLD